MPKILEFSTYLTMLGCVFLTSCAHDLERESALRVGLERLGGKFTSIVLASSLTPEDRKASKRVLPTVEAAELMRTPFRENEQVSGRLFFLESITIEQDDALVAGSVRPTPNPSQNNMFGCGTSYSVKLKRVGVSWQPTDVREMSC